MLNKNIEDIEYKDIHELFENKVEESEILEYKSEIIGDNDIIKQVCSFANTRGGHIVFGIKESGKGGHPTETSGIDSSTFNKERIEQIILSHIVPRLGIKIKSIPVVNSEKKILLIQVPNSYQKPHQHTEHGKFYKRFNFASVPMAENEISNSYKNRFSNYEEIKQYLIETSLELDSNLMAVKILTIPSNIERRLFEPVEYNEIKSLQSIKIPPYLPDNSFPNYRLEPFAHGLRYNHNLNQIGKLEIHRNGCIQYVNHYDGKNQDDIRRCPRRKIAIKIMQILEFTGKILSQYNYFGDVKIITMLQCKDESMITDYYVDGVSLITNLNAKINREYSSQYIETDYCKISSSIMNEIHNHYGFIKSDLFDKEGNWIG